MTQNINLKAIRIDGGTQSRVALDTGVVAEYKAALADGKDLPPVIVFNDGTDMWLGDGFHRYSAYTEDGRASIPADVRVGTQRDAILYSCGANSSHGLRRTNEDKRRAVGIMLADPEWSKLSDRVIAKYCSVSHTFVSDLRNPKPVAPPPPPPPPPAEPKTPKQPPAPKGGNVANPPPADPPAPPSGPTEEEVNAEAAHGDSNLAELLAETQRDLEAAQRQIEVANADDAKAEAMKYQRIADIATRRQGELMQTVKDREDELRKHVAALRRIGKAVGEEDPTKVAATVEAFVRSMKVGA